MKSGVFTPPTTPFLPIELFSAIGSAFFLSFYLEAFADLFRRDTQKSSLSFTSHAFLLNPSHDVRMSIDGVIGRLGLFRLKHVFSSSSSPNRMEPCVFCHWRFPVRVALPHFGIFFFLGPPSSNTNKGVAKITECRGGRCRRRVDPTRAFPAEIEAWLEHILSLHVCVIAGERYLDNLQMTRCGCVSPRRVITRIVKEKKKKYFFFLVWK